MKKYLLILLFSIGCISSNSTEPTSEKFTLPAHYSGEGRFYEEGQLKETDIVSFDVLELDEVCDLIQRGGALTTNDTSRILAYSVNSPKNTLFIYGGYPIPILGTDTIMFDEDKQTITQKFGSGSTHYIAIAHR